MLLDIYSTTWLCLLGFSSFALALFTSIRYKSSKNSYPRWPGPALVPWIGRIHDLPIKFMWLKFDEWADRFGPIYRTQMLGTNWIVVSDENICEELLVKRARLYSDRPAMKSLFDSKSTTGTMEYLPLMGRNSMFRVLLAILSSLTLVQNTGPDNAASNTPT